MACNHKFKKHLQLQRLDFEPTTLIVGTFNPAWPESNYAEWFYGRVNKNFFWNVLPRIYKEPSMLNSKSEGWKAFCKRHKIAITDLISSIDDANATDPVHVKNLKNYSDTSIRKNFTMHEKVEVDKLLESNPTIKNVYFTRGTSDTFWKNLWKPVEKYAEENGIHEEKLMTPSRYVFYQQGTYNKSNPLNPLSLEDFILMKWKEKWHEI